MLSAPDPLHVGWGWGHRGVAEIGRRGEMNFLHPARKVKLKIPSSDLL
jgi:hypothetical protein